MTARCRDLDRLVPAFRERVVLVLERLRARGYNVQVWETYRSPERVAHLASIGTGSARSVHPYGVAVDIVEDDKTPWDPSVAGLWLAIRDEGEAVGLTSGLRFTTRHDGPHLQAIPVSMQGRVRALARKPNGPEAINDLVARWLAPKAVV